MRALLGVGLCLFAALSPAYAEIRLQKIQWQIAKRPGLAKNKTAQEPPGNIDTLKITGPRLDGKLRARLTLSNRGPKAAEGILLKYFLAGRLIPLAGQEPAVWAVPFLLDERRVPKVGPNQVQEITLEFSAFFDAYLKKIYSLGFVPEQLKLQIMVEPRRGDNHPIEILEGILPLEK